MDEKTKELVAVAAAGNCIPCLEWHYKKCIELVKTVKNVPIKKISDIADSMIHKKSDDYKNLAQG